MLKLLKQVRAGVSLLNPEEVRRLAERPLNVGLVASSSAGYAEMEDFLAPGMISHEKRLEVMQHLHRAGDQGLPSRFDVVLFEEGLDCPPHAFTFNRGDPGRTVGEVLSARDDLELALARTFYPFRKPAVDRIVNTISCENAFFALATALPNIVPSLIEVPWAVSEFASDTAFLTMNQIRMAFLVAAASDKVLGYKQQKTEVASIVAGAFGWRTIARELAGKIPLGGGLVAKGSIAFAGTFVIGKGLEHFHNIGYGYTRAERRNVYELAYERGKGVVEALLASLKKRTAA